MDEQLQTQGPDRDRRRFRRLPVDRVGKVFVRRALRYLPVRALDVSLGGLLLEVKTDRPLHVGEMIEVIIGDQQSAVVADDDVVEARIAHVRAGADGTQRVGLAFATEGAMAAVAA
ncbi:MAG: PilZ domain-containing protein [Phycisphaerales bacterium]|jgi:c-di-GMP-binding flagellar brake protein YcgR